MVKKLGFCKKVEELIASDDHTIAQENQLNPKLM